MVGRFPWSDHQDSYVSKVLAKSSVLDRLQGKGQKKGSNWSSRLGVGSEANITPEKNL
jgi:hypothetical protein